MNVFSRRAALRSALALGMAAPLAGCKEVIDVLGEACPEDPADQGGIDWVPDVMHPVAAAFQDVGTAQGAPGPARLWYPTFEAFTDEGGPPTPRRILKHCLARWPVVLFLHGQPPCPIPDYQRRWTHIPATLARTRVWSSASGSKAGASGAAVVMRLGHDPGRTRRTTAPRASTDCQTFATSLPSERDVELVPSRASIGF